MGYKGGHWQVHEECIACTAVWQKASLELKRCQTVKPVAQAIVELCKSEGIRQAGS